MKGPSRRFWLMLMIIAKVLIMTGGGTWASFQQEFRSNTIAPGTEISGIDVGGMQEGQARVVLREKLVIPDSISVQWDGGVFSIPLEEDAAFFNIDQAIADALEAGRSREGAAAHALNFVRWVPREIILTANLELEPAYLEKQLQAIKQAVDREPENAEITMENNIPKSQEGHKGIFLHVHRSRDVILEQLEKGHYRQIPLVVSKRPPRVTVEDLPDFSQNLGGYGTPLDPDQKDRVHNISLATKEFESVIIEAGDTLSFNETLGEATAEKGYREVLVIENRQFVPGIGGGVCQVSTTIYQAALRAELEIVQRSSHSRPVTYVSPGYDATISYNRLDLKIKNTLDFPVMLVGQVNEELRFDFYGVETDPDRHLDIVAEIEEELEPRILEKTTLSLPKGERKTVQPGQTGYRVNVYRVVYKGDQVVDRELVSTDTYLPVNTIVHVGIMSGVSK